VRRTSVLCLLALLTLAGCTSERSSGDSSAASQSLNASAPATAASDGQGCRRHYAPRPLPPWARTGFRPPTTPMPYVMGDRGDIVAVLWADHDPLVVPPAADRNNKILWVARVSSMGPLQIRARLTGSNRSASRTVAGGPGPSIIDLPAPGCWSIDLRWGMQHDQLRLEYAPR
jgi:hypothetical protein